MQDNLRKYTPADVPKFQAMLNDGWNVDYSRLCMTWDVLRAEKRFTVDGKNIRAYVYFENEYKDTGDYYKEFAGTYPVLHLTEFVTCEDGVERSFWWGAFIKIGKTAKRKWEWSDVCKITRLLTDDVLRNYVKNHEKELRKS